MSSPCIFLCTDGIFVTDDCDPRERAKVTKWIISLSCCQFLNFFLKAITLEIILLCFTSTIFVRSGIVKKYLRSEKFIYVAAPPQVCMEPAHKLLFSDWKDYLIIFEYEFLFFSVLTHAYIQYGMDNFLGICSRLK